MSSFLYFTEQSPSPVSLEQVESWGLGYALSEKPSSCQIEGRSPTGGRGWLFFDQKRLGDAFVGFNDALQNWRKIPNSDVWVGYDKARIPSPKSLMRDQPMQGELVKLADGNQWLIPRLRIFAGADGFQSALPVLVDLDENGQWVSGGNAAGIDHFGPIADRLTSGMIDSLLDESIEPLTTIEMLDIAVALLQASYVVNKVEVAMLKLLTDDQLLMQIGRAAVDFDVAMEWAVKKNKESDLPADVGSPV